MRKMNRFIPVALACAIFAAQPVQAATIIRDSDKQATSQNKQTTNTTQNPQAGNEGGPGYEDSKPNTSNNTTNTTGQSQVSAEAKAAADAIAKPTISAEAGILYDVTNGRVLFEKNADEKLAPTSTTKLMTALLVLEKAKLDDKVTFSKTAVTNLESGAVKIGLVEGDQVSVKDCLYGLLLKSANEVANGLAEHVSGSISAFADLMNAKAKELGCTNTHFVTPNGLDSADAGGIHQTTARDLALIMSYAVKNKAFLHITQTRDYSFSDISGKRQFSVHNANAFLDMTPDAISAGYCYVAACENEERKFIISLLGCGWPNNKTYKWKDAMKLLEYGKANFHKETYWQEPEIPAIPVKDGTDESSGKESGKENQENSGRIFTETGTGFADVYINGRIQASDSDKKKQILLKEGEKITCRLRIEKNLTAPVKKGQKIGQVTFSLGELVLDNYFVTADRNIVKITYLWCANKVFHDFFH